MHLNNFNKKSGSGRKNGECENRMEVMWKEDFIKDEKPESCLNTGEKEPIHKEKLKIRGDRR